MSKQVVHIATKVLHRAKCLPYDYTMVSENCEHELNIHPSISRFVSRAEFGIRSHTSIISDKTFYERMQLFVHRTLYSNRTFRRRFLLLLAIASKYRRPVLYVHTYLRVSWQKWPVARLITVTFGPLRNYYMYTCFIVKTLCTLPTMMYSHVMRFSEWTMITDRNTIRNVPCFLWSSNRILYILFMKFTFHAWKLSGIWPGC
jgi:hypothetical protein